MTIQTVMDSQVTPMTLSRIHSSLLRFCRTFADDRNSFGCDLEVVNFDAYAEIEDLPKQDQCRDNS